MLWLILLLKKSVTTGLIDRYFTFVCANCHASTAAMVRMSGSGSGWSASAAQRAAEANLAAASNRAVEAAACPRCAQLAPSTLEGLERAAVRTARRRAMRPWLALVASMVTAILLAMPAMGDFRNSIGLPLVALFGATGIGAIVFAVLAPSGLPAPIAAGVWFSHDPSQGPGSWFVARGGPVPVVALPSKASQRWTTATILVSIFGAVAGLFLWVQSFRLIHVISTEGDAGVLVVRVDGVEVGRVGGPSSADAPFKTFKVRSGSVHHLVVEDTVGRTLTYDLDPREAWQGWAVIPHARERGLCLASDTWHYGPDLSLGLSPDDRVLNEAGAGDLVSLPKSFDFVLTSPPSEIQTKRVSETRSSLRAFDCEGLDNGQQVPFKDVSRRLD